MSETTDDLSAQLAETTAALEGFRGELAVMQQLAQATHTPYEEPDDDELSFDQQFEPHETQFADSVVAASPARPVLPPPVQRQPQTMSQEQLAAAGIELVAQKVPDWNTYAERVFARAADNPVPFSRALSSGSPEVVASLFESSADVVRTKDSNRARKLAAQSASGASGHADLPSGDVAEWQAVVAAAPRNYWGG